LLLTAKRESLKGYSGSIRVGLLIFSLQGDMLESFTFSLPIGRRRECLTLALVSSPEAFCLLECTQERGLVGCLVNNDSRMMVIILIWLLSVWGGREASLSLRFIVRITTQINEQELNLRDS
jgi:hypothetical protein